MWAVATNAREGSRTFEYYFRTEAEAFHVGLETARTVNIVVGNGIGFKVTGGYKPYKVSEGNSSIVRSFRQGNNECGEDFQINALSPGTTQVEFYDASTPPQHLRVTVNVMPKGK